MGSSLRVCSVYFCMIIAYFVGFLITFTTVFFLEPHWDKMGILDKFLNTLLLIFFSALWPLCMYKCAYNHLYDIRKWML